MGKCFTVSELEMGGPLQRDVQPESNRSCADNNAADVTCLKQACCRGPEGFEPMLAARDKSDIWQLGW